MYTVPDQGKWFVMEKWSRGHFLGFVQESDSPHDRFGPRDTALEFSRGHLDMVLRKYNDKDVKGITIVMVE